MLMPKRSYAAATAYRYGFNGKENDNDVKGLGNQQDYGMRIYDPRLGKFLSVDPIAKSYPSHTPYSYALNRPLDGVDLDGLEWIHYKVQFKRMNDGRAVVLSKTVVEDYRNKSESELNKIHGTNAFYSKFSTGFGKKGRGVEYTYEEFDENDAIKSKVNTLELEFSRQRHGMYAGKGCITLYGELLTPGEYGNYDFGMKPIDMPDALAKEHDFLQNKENHKGFMHTDYLNSDILLLAKLQIFRKDFESNPNHIDPFTGRKVSAEAKKFTKDAIELFQMFVALKTATLDAKLANKEISQEEYNRSTFLLRNPSMSENAPMPQPKDKLNNNNK